MDSGEQWPELTTSRALLLSTVELWISDFRSSSLALFPVIISLMVEILLRPPVPPVPPDPPDPSLSPIIFRSPYHLVRHLFLYRSRDSLPSSPLQMTVFSSHRCAPPIALLTSAATASLLRRSPPNLLLRRSIRGRVISDETPDRMRLVLTVQASFASYRVSNMGQIQKLSSNWSPLTKLSVYIRIYLIMKGFFHPISYEKALSTSSYAWERSLSSSSPLRERTVQSLFPFGERLFSSSSLK